MTKTEARTASQKRDNTNRLSLFVCLCSSPASNMGTLSLNHLIVVFGLASSAVQAAVTKDPDLRAGGGLSNKVLGGTEEAEEKGIEKHLVMVGYWPCSC